MSDGLSLVLGGSAESFLSALQQAQAALRQTSAVVQSQGLRITGALDTTFKRANTTIQEFRLGNVLPESDIRQVEKRIRETGAALKREQEKLHEDNLKRQRTFQAQEERLKDQFAQAEVLAERERARIRNEEILKAQAREVSLERRRLAERKKLQRDASRELTPHTRGLTGVAELEIGAIPDAERRKAATRALQEYTQLAHGEIRLLGERHKILSRIPVLEQQLQAVAENRNAGIKQTIASLQQSASEYIKQISFVQTTAGKQVIANTRADVDALIKETEARVLEMQARLRTITKTPVSRRTPEMVQEKANIEGTRDVLLKGLQEQISLRMRDAIRAQSQAFSATVERSGTGLRDRLGPTASGEAHEALAQVEAARHRILQRGIELETRAAERVGEVRQQVDENTNRRMLQLREKLQQDAIRQVRELEEATKRGAQAGEEAYKAAAARISKELEETIAQANRLHTATVRASTSVSPAKGAVFGVGAAEGARSATRTRLAEVRAQSARAVEEFQRVFKDLEKETKGVASRLQQQLAPVLLAFGDKIPKEVAKAQAEIKRLAGVTDSTVRSLSKQTGVFRTGEDDREARLHRLNRRLLYIDQDYVRRREKLLREGVPDTEEGREVQRRKLASLDRDTAGERKRAEDAILTVERERVTAAAALLKKQQEATVGLGQQAALVKEMQRGAELAVTRVEQARQKAAAALIRQRTPGLVRDRTQDLAERTVRETVATRQQALEAARKGTSDTFTRFTTEMESSVQRVLTGLGEVRSSLIGVGRSTKAVDDAKRKFDDLRVSVANVQTALEQERSSSQSLLTGVQSQIVDQRRAIVEARKRKLAGLKEAGQIQDPVQRERAIQTVTVQEGPEIQAGLQRLNALRREEQRILKEMATAERNAKKLVDSKTESVRKTVRATDDLIARNKSLGSVIKNKVSGAFGAVASTLRRKVNPELQNINTMANKLRFTLSNIQGAFAAVGLSGIGRQSFGLSAQFEREVASINTLLVDAEVPISRYREQLLSLSTRSAKEVIDLTQGLYTAISAGVPAVEGARGAFELLDAAQKAAVAGLGTTREAVNALTTQVTAFAEHGLLAEKASDQLFETVRLGRTTFSDLSTTLGRAAGIANSFGLTSEAMLGSIATMTRVIPSTSESVTQLRAMLRGIVKPAKEVQDVIDQINLAFGTNIEFSARALKEKGMVEFFRELTEVTGGSADVIARLFPNVRGLAGAVLLTGESFETFAENVKKVEESTGGTERALAKVIGTVQEQAKILRSRIQATLIDATGPLEGRIGKLLRKIGTAFEENGGRFQKLLDKLLRIAENAITFIETNLDVILDLITGFLRVKFPVLFAIFQEVFLEESGSVLSGIGTATVNGLLKIGKLGGEAMSQAAATAFAKTYAARIEALGTNPTFRQRMGAAMRGVGSFLLMSIGGFVLQGAFVAAEMAIGAIKRSLQEARIDAANAVLDGSERSTSVDMETLSNQAELRKQRREQVLLTKQTFELADAFEQAGLKITNFSQALRDASGNVTQAVQTIRNEVDNINRGVLRGERFLVGNAIGSGLDPVLKEAQNIESEIVRLKNQRDSLTVELTRQRQRVVAASGKGRVSRSGNILSRTSEEQQDEENEKQQAKGLEERRALVDREIKAQEEARQAIRVSDRARLVVLREQLRSAEALLKTRESIATLRSPDKAVEGLQSIPENTNARVEEARQEVSRLREDIEGLTKESADALQGVIVDTNENFMTMVGEVKEGANRFFTGLRDVIGTEVFKAEDVVFSQFSLGEGVTTEDILRFYLPAPGVVESGVAAFSQEMTEAQKAALRVNKDRLQDILKLMASDAESARNELFKMFTVSGEDGKQRVAIGDAVRALRALQREQVENTSRAENEEKLKRVLREIEAVQGQILRLSKEEHVLKTFFPALTDQQRLAMDLAKKAAHDMLVPLEEQRTVLVAARDAWKATSKFIDDMISKFERYLRRAEAQIKLETRLNGLEAQKVHNARLLAAFERETEIIRRRRSLADQEFTRQKTVTELKLAQIQRKTEQRELAATQTRFRSLTDNLKMFQSELEKTSRDILQTEQLQQTLSLLEKMTGQLAEARAIQDGVLAAEKLITDQRNSQLDRAIQIQNAKKGSSPLGADDSSDITSFAGVAPRAASATVARMEAARDKAASQERERQTKSTLRAFTNVIPQEYVDRIRELDKQLQASSGKNAQVLQAQYMEAVATASLEVAKKINESLLFQVSGLKSVMDALVQATDTMLTVQLGNINAGLDRFEARLARQTARAKDVLTTQEGQDPNVTALADLTLSARTTVRQEVNKQLVTLQAFDALRERTINAEFERQLSLIKKERADLALSLDVNEETRENTRRALASKEKELGEATDELQAQREETLRQTILTIRKELRELDKGVFAESSRALENIGTAFMTAFQVDMPLLLARPLGALKDGIRGAILDSLDALDAVGAKDFLTSVLDGSGLAVEQLSRDTQQLDGRLEEITKQATDAVTLLMEGLKLQLRMANALDVLAEDARGKAEEGKEADGFKDEIVKAFSQFDVRRGRRVPVRNEARTSTGLGLGVAGLTLDEDIAKTGEKVKESTLIAVGKILGSKSRHHRVSTRTRETVDSGISSPATKTSEIPGVVGGEPFLLHIQSGARGGRGFTTRMTELVEGFRTNRVVPVGDAAGEARSAFGAELELQSQLLEGIRGGVDEEREREKDLALLTQKLTQKLESLLPKEGDKIPETDKVENDFLKIFITLRDNLGFVGEAMGDLVTRIVGFLIPALEKFGKAITGPVLDAAFAPGDKVLGAFGEAVNTLTGGSQSPFRIFRQEVSPQEQMRLAVTEATRAAASQQNLQLQDLQRRGLLAQKQQGVSPVAAAMRDLRRAFRDGRRMLRFVERALPRLIDRFFNFIIEKGPDFIERIANILVMAIEKVAARLPELMEVVIPAIMDFIKRVAGALIRALPDIVDAVLEGLFQFLKELPDVMGELFDAIAEAAPAIVTKIVENVPRIIGAIIEAIPMIAVRFVGALVTALKESLGFGGGSPGEKAGGLLGSIAGAGVGAYIGYGMYLAGAASGVGAVGIALAGLLGGGSIGKGLASFFHDGGTVKPSQRDPMLAAQFQQAGALAFRNGGIVAPDLSKELRNRLRGDEVPAILRMAERVLTPEQIARMGGNAAIDQMINGDNRERDRNERPGRVDVNSHVALTFDDGGHTAMNALAHAVLSRMRVRTTTHAGVPGTIPARGRGRS